MYNLKNVKNTHERVILLLVFFAFFKLYKLYQIAQSITYFLSGEFSGERRGEYSSEKHKMRN